MKLSQLGIIIVFVCAMIILMFTLFTMLSNGDERKDKCYKLHVEECLSCHSQNLSYNLCSGFCSEPIDFHLKYYSFCSWHPQEDCFDLPKECITR